MKSLEALIAEYPHTAIVIERQWVAHANLWTCDIHCNHDEHGHGSANAMDESIEVALSDLRGRVRNETTPASGNA